MTCTARSKQRQGAPCQGKAMKGRTVCYHHGGKSRLGPGHYKHVTGKYSKFLPSRMAADYAAVQKDPQLLELRDAIAAVDARIIDLLKRVDTGEAGALWQAARDAMARLRLEQAKNNIDGMLLAISQAERAISQGAGDYAAWHEIQALIEQRRKLCDSENRRVTQAHDSLNAEEAMVLLRVVVGIVQRHVTDRRILGAIAADIQGTVLARQQDGSYA
jgi:hypothetical protein